MKLFDPILRILGKPFPEEENRVVYFRNLFIISVFVALFLYIFEPFGLSTLESNQFIICLGFGSMTFLGVVVYIILVDYILRLKGKPENWTFGKWILNYLGIMFSISLANFLYARLLLIGYMDWSLFPQMVYGTFMVGIIPILMIGAFTLVKQERKYQIIADEINHDKKPISVAQDGDETSLFDIPTHRIRYIEALQNYAKIAFINTEGHLKSQTERVTLKEVLSQTEGSPIMMCHRSYLVNKEVILSASGNAQGLLLSLEGADKMIPVSRSYVPLFRHH